MRFLNATPAKRVIVCAIASAMLPVLSGCLPNLRRAEPGPALPADFNGRSDPQSSAQISVDDFFDDPVLTRLIAQALACNQELKIRNQQVQIAANEVIARRGAYLPFIALRGDAGLDKHSRFTPLGAAAEELEFEPGKHFPDPLPNFLLAANLFWQVDLWRELRNARDAAAQRYISEFEGRNYFITTLVAEVAQNYYELLALDARLEILDQTIAIQQASLKVAEANKAAARETELAVQRFQAEVRKNQSEKLIVRQEIIETENRINFLAGRFPQPVERTPADFINLSLHALSVGVPAQLLLNRRDIRAAEREMAAAGLDVMVARARFFPRLDITASVGYEAFNPRYFFNPDAVVANAAAGLVVPLLNRKAIQADYLTANARQLQTIYDYQRVVLNAFTEVITQLAKVENYRQSIEIKRQQLTALQASVDVANRLFNSPIPEARVEYVDVLLAQRDFNEARTVLVNTKLQQLSAIIAAYQALGGGCWLSSSAQTPPESEPGVVVPAPLPPQPGSEASPPAPPPAPAPLPLPAATTSVEATSTVGHATVEEMTSDAAEAGRAGGHENARDLAELPIVRQAPAFPQEAAAGDAFDGVVGPGARPAEANPFMLLSNDGSSAGAVARPELPPVRADLTDVDGL